MTPRNEVQSGTDRIPELEAELADMHRRLSATESRLAEAQEVLRAIRAGEVDAIVVSSPQGEQIFTLKGAEYAYRSLVESMNEGAATLGPDGTVLYCNQRLSDLIGLSIEHIIGQPAESLLPIDSEDFRQILADALNGLAVKRVMKLRSAEENSVPIQISLRRIALQEPPALSMVVTDLSDLTKQQDSLREIEDAFAIMADHVSAMIWMCYADGLVFYLNRPATEYTGLPLEEICGDGWLKTVHSDDREALTIAFQQAIKTGETFRTEARIQAANGTYRWFLLQAEPIRNSEGKIVRWCGSSADIEQIKHAEQEQRAQRRIIEKIVDQLPCGVALIRGSDLTFQLVNRTYQAFDPCRQFLGRTADEAWPEARPVFAERCRSVLNSGEPLNGEDETFRFTSEKDGIPVLRYLSWSVSRMPLPEDGEDGILVTVWDTTRRKQVEEALQLQSQQLRALSERMRHVREEERKILARDLHDRLGQILTAIKMDLSWLSRRCADELDGMKIRLMRSKELCAQGSQAVHEICRRLRPPVLDDLGLGAAIEWESKEFTSRSGVTCSVSLPSVEVALEEGISTSLFRIVQESLTNVIRHANATSVHIALEFRKEEVYLEIADDGKGFVESEEYHSFGLMGMSERAQSCGGKISISSAPGAGTTVTVIVPLHSEGEK